MVMLRIEMVPLDNYDLSNNSGYATVELTSIYNDPSTWPHKVILPSFLEKGKAFLSRKQDVDPGTYPVYVGMKLTNYAFVYMDFSINIYEDATNKRLFNATFTMPTYQNVKTQAVGQLTVLPSGGTTPGNVTLTLTVGSNGRVTVTLPDGRSETRTPGTYTYTVQSGSWITLDASPDTGYYFDGYYEGGSRISSSTRLYIQVSQNRSIEARFKTSSTPPSGSYILTYNVGPNGTLYIGNDAYRNTSGQKTYPAGTQVDIRVEPDQGYEIESVTINGSPLPTATPFTYTITMSGNVTVNVSFKKAEKPPTTDVGEIINKIMNSMLPPMMSMMGMMMMMQMMVGMMTGMAQSLAGVMAA
jgi:hypothetical protein